MAPPTLLAVSVHGPPLDAVRVLVFSYVAPLLQHVAIVKANWAAWFNFRPLDTLLGDPELMKVHTEFKDMSAAPLMCILHLQRDLATAKRFVTDARFMDLFAAVQGSCQAQLSIILVLPRQVLGHH